MGELALVAGLLMLAASGVLLVYTWIGTED